MAGKEAVSGVDGIGLPYAPGSAVLPWSSVLLLWSWAGLMVAAPELANMSQVGAASLGLQGRVRYLLDRVNLPPRSECSCV